MICVGLTGSALFSFNKGDDRNFQIAKNLDIFNAIFKELDMFYVDTIAVSYTHLNLTALDIRLIMALRIY